MKLKIIQLDKIRNKYPNPEQFKIFLESGTFKSDTIIAMEPYFEELHTIEIKGTLYETAKEKCGELPKIKLYLGDTSKIIDKILEEIGDKPIIFFLDAHWSCGLTGKGEKEVPLLEELQLINKYYNQNCIIIIDDYRLFDGNDEYVDWSEITKESVLSCIDKEKVFESYVENDRFILFCKKV